MNISDLVASYKTDQASSYGALRFRTRKHYDGLCRFLEVDLGVRNVANLKSRDLLLVHQHWSKRGTAMAHALVTMLRILCSYGGTILEDDDCLTLSTRLHHLRFKNGQPRTVRLTADQANAIRSKAHELGLRSIALAQAFQFDLMLRQKDVIGEWVPMRELGESETRWHGQKWLRGVRWEEIDRDLILRHTTSKRQKDVEIDLKLAPGVMAELGMASVRPLQGPLIVSETTRLPYTAPEFRRQWRSVARLAGVPQEVQNRDSRAGAISEATDAGVSLELVRHAATHSDIATTARYSRGSAEKIAEVMRQRAAYRR